jgi:hypothetical protein
MSCCGQKREAVSSAPRPARVDYAQTRLAFARSPQPPAAGESVTLKFRNGSAMVVTGASGKRYQFHGKGSMQAVDRGDAELLLASGLFERVWG